MNMSQAMGAAASSMIRVHLPQDIGWRPCPCPACLPRGAFNARRIRDKYEPEPKPVSYEALKATVARSTDKDELLDCLWRLSRKRRKADPAFLSPLLDMEDAELHEELAHTLACFNHPASTAMLQALCRHPSADVKEAAAQSLLRRFRQDAVALLTAYNGDPVIDTVIADAQGSRSD